MSNLRRQRGFVFLAVIAAVVLLIAIALAAWYLIIIPDRPLDPGITNALQRHHDAVPPQDNLFFALLAFDSTNAENINPQGQAIYAAYLARRAADPKSGVTFDNAVPVVRQAFVGDRAGLCGGRGKPEDLRRLITDNRLFVDRYDGAAGYKRLFLTDIAFTRRLLAQCAVAGPHGKDRAQPWRLHEIPVGCDGIQEPRRVTS
jgi:hypothetical protein